MQACRYSVVLHNFVLLLNLKQFHISIKNNLLLNRRNFKYNFHRLKRNAWNRFSSQLPGWDLMTTNWVKLGVALVVLKHKKHRKLHSWHLCNLMHALMQKCTRVNMFKFICVSVCVPHWVARASSCFWFHVSEI